MKSPILLTMLLMLPALSACQSDPWRTDAAPPVSPKKSSVPVQTQQSPPAVQLSPDVIYGLLVGEIATQRGDYDLAYTHYLHVARIAGDAKAAERATRIAMHLKRDEAALKAAQVWIGLEPDSALAHQIAAILEARGGNLERAEDHLQAIVRIYQSQGEGGWLEAGVVATQTENAEVAMELMQRLVRNQKQNPQARYALAVVAVGSKQYALAEAEARKALALQPRWPQAQVLLSRILVARGDMSGARKVLSQAVEQNPDDTLVRVAYARLLVDSKDFADAYEQFAEVHRQQPNNDDVIYALGILALQLERNKDAREHFEQLISLHKREDEAAFYLGQIDELEGHADAAAEWYGRVKSEYFVDAQIRRAQLAAHAGDLNRARELLQQLRQQAPGAAVRGYLAEAEILREAGREADVMGIYDQAIAALPGNEDLLYARALFAATVDRLDILEDDLQAIIRKDPLHADALNALGYTLADQTTRYDEALGYIKRALAIKPDNAAILDSMGWIQYRLGNYQEALKYLQRAMELMPDPEIAAHLGEVLWVSGARDRAREVWNEAVLKDPGSAYLQKVMKRYP